MFLKLWINSKHKKTPLNHSAVLIWNLDLTSTRSIFNHPPTPQKRKCTCSWKNICIFFGGGIDACMFTIFLHLFKSSNIFIVLFCFVNPCPPPTPSEHKKKNRNFCTFNFSIFNWTDIDFLSSRLKRKWRRTDGKTKRMILEINITYCMISFTLLNYDYNKVWFFNLCAKSPIREMRAKR